ncbi:MAG: leucine-rich repeat protein [Prevotellaceae bacterium]|nr:leucine-rich repeat protein [Prevotellaceae bacterium]
MKKITLLLMTLAIAATAQTVAQSSNANLQGLSLFFYDTFFDGDVELTPAFDANITNYTVNVSYFNSSIGGYGYIADSKATINSSSINNTGGTSFQFYKTLQVGENIITFIVTAEDSVTQKTYTLVVTREALQERAETINVTTPGTLRNYILEDDKLKITKLTITGNIDARDIYFLDSLSHLIELDLGDANIVAYEGIVGWWNSRLYSANELPENSFRLPYFTSIVLPKTLTSIGSAVLNFDVSALTSLTIPEGVTKIGYVFANYKRELTTLSLPSTLTEIGGDSFFYCDNLTTVINHNPNPIEIDCVFTCREQSFSNERTLYVPFGSGAAYREAHIWKLFNVVELPDVSDVSVVPSDTSVLLVWQPYDNAEGYKLLIYANEAHTELVCTLEYDSAGQLFNTILHRARTAQQTVSPSFTATVEHLLSGTTYYYTLQTLGASNALLSSQSGSFTTTGEQSNTGVVSPVGERSRTVACYSILGQKLPKEPESGIYIILYDNGTAKKFVK